MRTLQSSFTLAWISDLTVDRFYASCIVAGFAFALLLLASGHRTSPSLLRWERVRGWGRFRIPRRIRTFAKNVSGDGNGVDFVPLAFGGGLVGLGLAGIALRDLVGLAPFPSLLGAAVLDAVFVSLFLRLLRAAFADTGREMEGSSLVGAIAQVSLAIPVSGVGSVSYSAGGKRHTAPARTADGRPVQPSERVMVVDLARGIAIVEEF